MTERCAPVTSSANATFSAAVRSGSRRKSWKMKLTLRRRIAISRRRIVSEEKPLTRTSPLVGQSAMWISRRIVDLPAPLCPVRKQNSPLWSSNDTSFSASPTRGYSLWTWSNRIMSFRLSRASVRPGPHALPVPAKPTLSGAMAGPFPYQRNPLFREPSCPALPVQACREPRGEANRLDHGRGVGAVLPGDVQRRPVVRRGPHEGEAERDVDAVAERGRLEGGHAHVVVGGDHGVELAGRGADEHRVRGDRAARVDALRLQPCPCGLQDARLLIAEQAAIGGVRVHGAQRDAGRSEERRV